MPQRRRPMRPPTGFTLLELMVALVVVSILLTVGLPSFSAMVRQNCAITTANTMLTVLTTARSEALKRDRRVAVCKTTDGTACSTSADVGWNQGYLMFVDANGNGRPDAGEALIQSELPLSACSTITGVGNFANRVTYTGLGRTTSASHFRIATPDTERPRRRVIVSPSGRPRVCDPDRPVPAGGTACGTG